MSGYKTDDNRLIAIFKSSRDSWKNKCALKQKKIKALEIKLRDPPSSRAKCQHRTKVIQTQLADKEDFLQEQSLLIKAQQAEIQLLKKNLNHSSIQGSIPFWKKNRKSREIRKMMVKLKEDLR
jgi:hypothetical protein